MVSKRTAASSNLRIPLGEQFFTTAEGKHQKWRSLVASLWEFLSDHAHSANLPPLLSVLSITPPIFSALMMTWIACASTFWSYLSVAFSIVECLDWVLGCLNGPLLLELAFHFGKNLAPRQSTSSTRQESEDLRGDEPAVRGNLDACYLSVIH